MERLFVNAGLVTKLEDRPQFMSDYPLDEWLRKLRLRTFGIPLSSFKKAKESIESELNVIVTKMENPGGNKEYIDIQYSTVPMPEIWALGHISGFKDFSFPIGKTYGGEVRSSLKRIPHYLVAGETGGGKSTFIRMMLIVLMANNDDIEMTFIDLKGGMENQLFMGLGRSTLLSEIPDVATKLSELDKLLTQRMSELAAAKCRNIDIFNAKVSNPNARLPRQLIVVDEISELIPTTMSTHKVQLYNINRALNRVARLGRAVGIHLVIGVQKPDAKNLDPTIKANLPGVVCFPVSHFSQSMVVLGNGRGAELNAAVQGRAIWKHGIEEIEVQTPLLTDADVAHAIDELNASWGRKEIDVDAKAKEEIKKATQALSEGVPASDVCLEVEDRVEKRDEDGDLFKGE
jgi:DNA segregation ATPase FtsK/SpoIIIE-like protein